MTVNMLSVNNGHWGSVVINDALRAASIQGAWHSVDPTDDATLLLIDVIVVAAAHTTRNDSFPKRSKFRRDVRVVWFSGEPYDAVIPEDFHSCVVAGIGTTAGGTTGSVTPSRFHVPYFVVAVALWWHTSSYALHVPVEKRAGVAYCSRNKVHMREVMFDALVQAGKGHGVDAHALGKCHGKDNANAVAETTCGGWGGDELRTAYSHHRFVIAMENTQVDGYVTEKLFNALASGAVPIYWGDATTAKRLVGAECMVCVEDFDSVDDVAAHIVSLHNDTVAYARIVDASPLRTEESTRMWLQSHEWLCWLIEPASSTLFKRIGTTIGHRC